MTMTTNIELLAARIAAEFNAVRSEMSGGEAEIFLARSGGTMFGEIDMGFNKIVGMADPEWPQDAVNKQYVDNSIAPLAALPRLTLNLQTSTGSITTSPVIADALATIGTTNGYTVNLGFGEYRETGPIVVNEKWQLQLNGNRTAGTTSSTIKNGLTVQNSNGVRLHTLQIEGASSISCRAGLGIYAERCQFMGNVTLGGTGGFMMFIDCDFAGNITIPNTFAGTVYFVRCQFSNASGVYTFSQTSPVQAIIFDSGGIPNASIANASFSGLTTYKSGAQAMFVNGLPLYYSGTTAMRPSTATTGFMFFDTSINKPIWRSGSTWRDATGATV